MRITRYALPLIGLFCVSLWAAQSPPSPEAAAKNVNPFARFFGEWTLKNDDWTQNWGSATERIKIPHHHTLIKPINTNLSVLSIVDTPPQGHIFWTYNPVKKEVRHLSSFGDLRIGVGQGTLSDAGDLHLKVSFQDEAPGTYRVYTYIWQSDDEYELKSVQFDEHDKPTGLFYGGTFKRLRH